MGGVVKISTWLGLASTGSIPFRTRLLIYGGIWLSAAFLILVIPDSELTFSEKMVSVMQTPLIVAFGLSMLATFPQPPSELVGVVVIAVLIFHACAVLTLPYRKSFQALVAIHLAILVVATVYLVRFSNLPSGG